MCSLRPGIAKIGMREGNEYLRPLGRTLALKLRHSKFGRNVMYFVPGGVGATHEVELAPWRCTGPRGRLE